LPNVQHQLRLAEGFLINYELRSSKRSRYLRMRLTEKGLIVSKPWSVSLSAVESWLLSKSAWIIKHWPVTTTEPVALILPHEIELKTLQQTIQVHYQAADNPKPRLQFNPEQQSILIKGKIADLSACQSLLLTWLKRYAQLYLPPLLAALAHETGLNYQSCSIKNQQTRWGSCSSRGNINLNAKLLLLPAEWTRYVLIHELCHTREMNHSARFWDLVTQFQANYSEIHTDMKHAMQTLPSWLK
jgi:hypothetical protein